MKNKGADIIDLQLEREIRGAPHECEDGMCEICCLVKYVRAIEEGIMPPNELNHPTRRNRYQKRQRKG